MLSRQLRINGSTVGACAARTTAICRRHQATAASPPLPPPRRVVITGLGAVSPVGTNVATAWQTILAGRSGVVALTDESFAKLPCRIAGRVPDANSLIDAHLSQTEQKTMAPATAFAMVAAHQALTAAGWPPASAPDAVDNESDESRLRTGVAVGMGVVDLADICATQRTLDERGLNRISPFFVPRILTNMAAGQISMRYDFRGPNHAVSTACATGVHAIGDAFRFVKYGDADVMVCGGAEACIGPLALAGFCRLRALCTTANERPETGSRPFDRDRSGFVMGEGAAILVLEELEHARARGAPIVAEVLGYGLSGDAAHLTSPRPDALGARLAMQRAMREARVAPTAVGYVNAHATSTPIGDAIESLAIRKVFGEHATRMAVSSTKGAHGHLLGSAGNLEMVFASLAVQTGDVPPTINHENVSEEMNLNYVPNVAQRWPDGVTEGGRRVALKNAFGFGGTNASLCIAEYLEGC